MMMMIFLLLLRSHSNLTSFKSEYIKKQVLFHISLAFDDMGFFSDDDAMMMIMYRMQTLEKAVAAEVKIWKVGSRGK